MEKELVGFELEEKSLSLDGENLVGKAVAKHQGKIGFLKVSVEGGISAIPVLNKVIDIIEEKIPGDQKMYAQIIKDQIAKIKIKF